MKGPIGSLPDPYINDPTTARPGDLYYRYLRVVAEIAAAEKERDDLRKKLEEIMGDAHAGLVDGKKVITNRPMNRVAEQALLRKYPDLTAPYIKPTLVDKLDLATFSAQHPDVVAEFQSRQFRIVAS